MRSIDPTESVKTAVTPTFRYGLHDFGDAGLLWLINETVFWPRGFCLNLGIDTATGEHVWWLEGDGTEPWQVSSAESAQNRFEQSKRFFESTAAHNQEVGAYA